MAAGTEWADASHYNAVNLGTYFASHDRLGIKVTEGTGYVDPTFAGRYAYAKAAGKPMVLYHFDRARFDGADQFDWFMQNVRAAGGPRPWPLDLFCLDTEDTNYPQGAAESAARFTGRALQVGYPKGSGYTGVWFAKPYGITPEVFAPGWRHLWLSDYNSAHADNTMPLPPGWTRAQVIARQFTSTASVAGVNGPCDYSRVINEWLPVTPAAEQDDSKEDGGMFYMEAPGRAGVVIQLADLSGVPTGAVRDAFQAAAKNGMVGAPVNPDQWDLVYNWARANGLPTKRYDDGAATLREMLQQWPAVRSQLATLGQELDGLTQDVAAVRAAIGALQVGGGSVDADALAAKVADLLSARLQS
jgi:hypothetical protein